ncbi:MAG: DUF951 domain-containing protein [Actinobacteria bacterium]|nr:MAG: DUF951 domain-containing protein [Actinomycetota bacterium]
MSSGDILCTLAPPRVDAIDSEDAVTVPIVPVRIGDVVRLKKPHPCGANEWEVNKLGMDIGLTCLGCDRKVRLERYEFDRRFRGFERRAEPHEEV